MSERSGKHPPIRALVLSVMACAIPVSGAIWLPDVLEDYQALLWLIALVPTFLLAYYRGWRGAATATAAGMAIISVTYAVTQAMARPVPELLPAVIFFFIAIALGAGALAERLRRQTSKALAKGADFTDAATGLPNRPHAELHLEIEFSAAQRGRPVAVVLLDFDGFKGLHGRQGSISGDETLREIGDLLKRTSRRMNLSARFADDQFLCILGGCDDDGAIVFLNRLLEELQRVMGEGARTAVSSGIASFGPSMRSHHDLMAAAETALKQAKKEGRGRTRVYGRSAEITRGVAVTAGESEGRRNPAPAMPQGRGYGRRALIVAEDVPVRALLARLMTDYGFTVAQVTNVVDGVQCLTIEYDLLLTDISLTEGFGAELVRAAKLRWPAIQVLGIVKEQEGQLLIETLNAGVDRYLVTPLDLAKVRHHITELLARRDRTTASILESRQETLEFKARTNEAIDALRNTQEEYHHVVSTLHEVVFRADADGRLTSLNAPWTAATGYAVEESLGRVVTDFIHEDDREACSTALEGLSAADHPDVRAETRIITNNGEARWFELRMRRMLDSDRKFTGIAGALEDITARRNAELALRRSEAASRGLLAALPDDVYRLSRDGLILAYEGAPEGTDRHPAIGATIEDAFPTAVAAAVRERVERVLKTGVVERYEYRVITDEELSEYEIRIAVASDNEAIAIVRNITDKKLLEEQLKQSQKLEAIGRLAGGLAHDFNNLLTVIQGNAQLLAEESLPDGSREFVDHIDAAADRGATLVRQLLAFGRRQVMQPVNVDLNVIVANARSMLARLIGENVMLDVDLDPALGQTRVDPGQIDQILLNLAVNARDALPNGGHVKITTRNAVMAVSEGDTAEDFVTLTISDDGIGMDTETQGRIFEPFFTTKPFGQASGLGLATVYGIVRQSGGMISVNSEPGRGTTFEIALPRVHD